MASPGLQNPLFVQGDQTVLVEVDSPRYPEARDALARFAELVKSPEHIHTYRVTPLSFRNAGAVGETAETIAGTLRRLSKYPLPRHLEASVRDFAARYGCLQLNRRDADSLGLVTRSGRPFTPRHYRREAAEMFHAGGAEHGGSGVIVLPCGAGKTIVGMACLALVRASTLILTTNVTAVRQWKSELLDKTTLDEDDIGESSGNRKEVRPVTIATYQILTHRPSKESEFTHFSLFDERDWGLIIYDEVHLLPAPVFQITV